MAKDEIKRKLEKICKALKKVKPSRWTAEPVFAEPGPKRYRFCAELEHVRYHITGVPYSEDINLSITDSRDRQVDCYDNVRKLYSVFEKLVEQEKDKADQEMVERINSDVHAKLDEAMAENKKLKK